MGLTSLLTCLYIKKALYESLGWGDTTKKDNSTNPPQFCQIFNSSREDITNKANTSKKGYTNKGKKPLLAHGKEKTVHHGSRREENLRHAPRKGRFHNKKSPPPMYQQDQPLVIIGVKMIIFNGGIGGDPLYKRGRSSGFRRRQGKREV